MTSTNSLTTPTSTLTTQFPMNNASYFHTDPANFLYSPLRGSPTLVDDRSALPTPPDKPDNIVTDAATILSYLNALEFQMWASEVLSQGDLGGPLWDWDALAPTKIQVTSPAPYTTLGDEEHALLCQLQGIDANASTMPSTTTNPTEPAASMALTIWTTNLHHPTHGTSTPLPSNPSLTTDYGSDLSKHRRHGSWADDSPHPPRCLACVEWDVRGRGSTAHDSAHARRWNHHQPYCS
jgi:hypothetical protein